MKPAQPPPSSQPAINPPAKPKRKNLNPQALVSKFWKKYHSKTPGKVTSIFPQSLYESLLTDADSSEPKTRNAAQSYEAAAKNCRARVRAVVKECERTNAKFSDPDFDIESDFASHQDNCLFGLVRNTCPICGSDSDDDEDIEYGSTSDARWTKKPRDRKHSDALKNNKRESNTDSLRGDGPYHGGFVCRQRRPGSVHRIPWIFENPQFTIDGFSSSDVKQGATGNCWWLAALATIAHRKDLMRKICVARDEECGVYGFVIYRDGEWISTVVDDNLYLKNRDFGEDSQVYDATLKKARQYKKQKQTGSEALYFAKCEDPNETWLPLLEKASMEGGWSGTAVEDLTGGVATVVAGNRVLRKERLWREMLGSDGEDGEFVFGLSAGGPGDEHKNGIVLQHAYSVLRVAEVQNEDGVKFRLVKIRSEAGQGEWHGPWSDGSKEWTPYMIKKLKHEFGDDGVFWMSFGDMLDNFKWMYRTRLFDERWTVAQQWLSISISWLTGYLKKKFVIEVEEEGMVVIVLSQGQYEFTLSFLIKSSDGKNTICAVRPVHQFDRRSINCEVELEPGTYEVIPKIMAERLVWRPRVEKMVKRAADENPKKLRQLGLQYDLAHAKGGILDEDDALRKKREAEKSKKLKVKKQEVKKKQMAEAMARMEEAMVAMRNEYNQYLNEKENEKDKDKKDETAENDEEKKKDDEPEPKDPEPKDPVVEPKDKGDHQAPPGFWPEDSPSKGDLDVSKHPETLVEPRKEPPSSHGTNEAMEEKKRMSFRTPSPRGTSRRGLPTPPMQYQYQYQDQGPLRNSRRLTMTDYSMDPYPVFTPPTEPASDSDLDSSGSGSGSGSDTASDDNNSSSSDSDGMGLYPRRLFRQRKRQPWNAVCVIGLRVYAQHAGIKVRLADQKRDEATELVAPEASSTAGPSE
ncbi:hypothetical protein FGSG_01569 [Fusarium graminearum PH-1]|uniref:Calpain catalytic domain-containing protein n=1 Tax=Gibberella zeae (strain ATCC MYA-4620 / CBS 123657 / FGSC 9075 / NRRL 31084 / PH-1) TaxID=229533 RepID=I1RD77_GIBZE|nr:hypothetical protein FGSG_01569 [Fusarium graminearum PH-1]ESU06897.1 hypothetical protein FGSG_01569 [Fusarium graminearum PH-1]EYB22634.1 hypothetical protein FG05_01569 [Fusarium graminearum]|eukprot:XP_011317382.1 hypothetical protein FGSG_01569 [Fusarium graminearum PH-1]